jgi:hypothetical protein
MRRRRPGVRNRQKGLWTSDSDMAVDAATGKDAFTLVD